VSSPSKKIFSSGGKLISVIIGTVFSITYSLKLFLKIGENFRTILLLSINNDFFKGSLSMSKIKFSISLFYYYCSFK